MTRSKRVTIPVTCTEQAKVTTLALGMSKQVDEFGREIQDTLEEVYIVPDEPDSSSECDDHAGMFTRE